MNRKTGLTTLALGLILVGGAATASSAAAHEFFVPEPPATVTSDMAGEHIFAIGGFPITCASADFHGIMSEEYMAEFVATAAYTECEDESGSVTVEMNECKWVFGTITFEEHAPLTLECPAEQVMEIITAMPKCTFTLGAQQAELGVTYLEDTILGGTDLTVTITATLTAEKVHGALCALLPKAVSYTATTTFTGFEDENGSEGEKQVDLKLEKDE